MKRYAVLLLLLVLVPWRGTAQSNYVGVGECAGCHFARVHNDVPPAFTTWNNDPHRAAFSGGVMGRYGTLAGLKGTRAKDIARKLGVPVATESASCLRCHAGAVDAALVQDGVQCESCHGPARGYLLVHQKDYEGAVAQGMIDLHKPGAAAAQCLTCHGPLDDVLLKAGHPSTSGFNTGAYADGIRHWRSPLP